MHLKPQTHPEEEFNSNTCNPKIVLGNYMMHIQKVYVQSTLYRLHSQDISKTHPTNMLTHFPQTTHCFTKLHNAYLQIKYNPPSLWLSHNFHCKVVCSVFCVSACVKLLVCTVHLRYHLSVVTINFFAYLDFFVQ